MSIQLDADKVRDLRKEFGEAFYLLDSAQFRQNFQELKGAFLQYYPRFNIAYSYKTNYTPKLCEIVDNLGGYAEVVSEMELELAYRIGVKTENIIWNGPVKNPVILQDYLLRGGMVNIDSYEEFLTIREIVKAYPEKSFRLGIRCNFDVQDGVISRFGVDIQGPEYDEMHAYMETTPNVKFVSLQCHFAKRQIEYWPARVQGMLSLVERMKIRPERIDLGGALYGKMADSLKNQFSAPIPGYADYARLAGAFYETFGDCGPELIIEPGSALVGDCMKFLGTVKTIKTVRGKTIATILGSQKNISMTGINPPMEIIHMGKGKKIADADIVGFTCIEGDLLYKGFTGEIGAGDAVVFGNCGSYSIVMKPPFILPNFPVIDISGGKTELIKRPESFDDIFRSYTL